MKLWITLLLLVGAVIALAWWFMARRPAVMGADALSATGVSGEPIEVVDVLEGKLRVRIFSHVITSQDGPVPCWTYVSDGLLAHGQKEIALTVKREPGEAERDFPTAPLDLYRSLHGHASRGNVVREGDASQLNPGQPGLLRADFHAVLYTPSQALEGVSSPGPYLTALLITAPELAVAQRLGHLRLMALLGQRYRFYPTAPWADRKRPEITRPEAMASSIIARMPVLHLAGASARLEPGAAAGDAAVAPDGKVVLRLGKEAANDLLEAIGQRGAESAFTLSMDLDPEADACLVWSPGQQALSAISMPGGTSARISGNVLLIAPAGEDDGVKLIEDGFGLLLTPASWARLRTALAAHEPLTLPGTGDLLAFTLAWVEEAYQNPIDGRTYVASEGWRTYFPSSGPDAGDARVVRSTGIRLLTAEKEIGVRVEVKALTDYIKKIDELLQAELGGDDAGAGYDVLVQLDLSPPQDAKTRLAARPSETAPPELAAVATQLQAIPGPPIRSGTVSLQLEYTVRGGAGEDSP